MKAANKGAKAPAELPEGRASTLRDPLILPYEINKTQTFLKQRLALESLQGGAL